jgi:hypothetical protein
MKRPALLAIALALWAAPAHACGWYLLKPPVEKTGELVGSNRVIEVYQIPLSQWQYEDVFASLRECKLRAAEWKDGALQDRTKILQGAMTRRRGLTDEDYRDLNSYAAQAMVRCVPSDDPRLAR